MINVIVVVSSLGLIGLILWWFFGKKKVTVAKATVLKNVQTAEIIVNGGYLPKVIELQAGMPAELVFIRKDPSSCLEEVVLPDFGVKATLPLNKKHTIKIESAKPGRYKYACGMNMFYGEIDVK